MLFFVADGLLIAAPYSVNGTVFAPGKPRIWSKQWLAAERGRNPFPYSVSGNGARLVAVLPDDAWTSNRHGTSRAG
jgi:hypothetical protein